MTLQRLQRLAILLQSYDYSIRYRHTSQHSNADALSRLPAGEDVEFDKKEGKITNIHEVYQTAVESLPLTPEVIAKKTDSDTTLKVVKRMIEEG